MRKKTKLVYGVGVNDADYPVTMRGLLNNKRLITWSCPFYTKWSEMLKHCHSKKFLIVRPTYEGCKCVPEWNYFTAFRAWMIEQDWEAKHLDKDILFVGNKIYGPDTCVFVDPKVNTFLTERQNDRGEWPIGVTFHKKTAKYRARCWDVTTRKLTSLGLYWHPEEAHQAWLKFKLEQAKILASEQSDPRVAAALIDRYENYDKYFGDGG